VDLVGGLRDTDRFNVIFFAGGSTVLAPASVPATAETVALALRAIEQQRGGGSTELAAALARAVALPREADYARIVAIVTDGHIAMERGAFELIQANLSGTSFFAFGIGSSVNRHLIEGMARVGRGEPFVVMRPEEAAETGRRFRQYIETPLLTSVEVDYDGFEVYDVEPPVVADLFAERPVVLVGKWRGAPTGRITLSGHAGGGAYTDSFTVADAAPGDAGDSLRLLWARERIARLSDFALGLPDADTVDEVTALGLSHSLLTSYTSFVAVVEEVRNPGRPAEIAGYAVGSEPELGLLALMLALVVATGVLMRKLAPAIRP
jgi:Ca-activated chloride channel family protein